MRKVRHQLLSWTGAILVIDLLCCSPAWCEPHVLLLRGWFGVFSTGLDTIAAALKEKGIPAQVEGHLYWKTAATELLRKRAEGDTGPIVLVGHSQGANNVIDLAQELAAQNVPVAVLVTLSPYNQNPVPSNVKEAINFYQSPGWGAALTAAPGFHGKLSNINLNDDPAITHVNIDKNARVQSEIERDITAALQRN